MLCEWKLCDVTVTVQMDLSILYNSDGTMKPASYFHTPPPSPLPPLTQRDRDLVARHLCGDKGINCKRFNEEASKVGVGPLTDDIVRDMLPTVKATQRGSGIRTTIKRGKGAKRAKSTLRSGRPYRKRSASRK